MEANVLRPLKHAAHATKFIEHSELYLLFAFKYNNRKYWAAKSFSKDKMLQFSK